MTARRMVAASLMALLALLASATLAGPALACSPGRLAPARADVIAEGWVVKAAPVAYLPLGAWTPAEIVVEVTRALKGDVPNPLRFVSGADWLPGIVPMDLAPGPCPSTRIFRDDPNGKYGSFVLTRRAGSLATAPGHGNTLGYGPEDPGISQARDHIRTALRADPTAGRITPPEPAWLAWIAPVSPLLAVLGPLLFVVIAGFGLASPRTRRSRQ